MSGLFSPKLNILSTWNSTIGQAFQLFRRVLFVVEDTFSWGTWTPTLTGNNGMTVSAVHVRVARYLKIGKMFWFRLDLEFTPVAPLSTAISVSIPVTTLPDGTGTGQFFGLYLLHGGAGVATFGNAQEGQNYISFYRPNIVNYAAGVARAISSGFLEVQ